MLQIDELSTSEFGKTHGLVARLLQEYIGKSYIIFMDNFYSSPYLFFEIKEIQTGAVETLRTTRKGVPKGIRDAVLEKKGDSKVMSYLNDISILKVFDRKAVTLMSTVYNSKNTDTGRKHFQTRDYSKDSSND